MKKLCSDFFMPQRLCASGLAIVHRERCNKHNSKKLPGLTELEGTLF